MSAADQTDANVQFGAVLPQTESGAGPEDIGGFAEGAAGVWLRFVTMYDSIASRARWTTVGLQGRNASCSTHLMPASARSKRT